MMTNKSTESTIYQNMGFNLSNREFILKQIMVYFHVKIDVGHVFREDMQITELN